MASDETVADICAKMHFHAEQNRKDDRRMHPGEMGVLTAEANICDSYADDILAAHDREVAPLREIVEMLARVILPEQEEYPAEYGGGKVKDKNEWLGWVRAMQLNAKSALGEKGGNDGK